MEGLTELPLGLGNIYMACFLYGRTQIQEAAMTKKEFQID